MNFRNIFLVLMALAIFQSCSSDDDGMNPDDNDDPIFMDVAVGGPLEPNSVYIDLENGEQTTVARDSWDLGFSSENEFRLVLNPGANMMAQSIDKYDLSEVNSTDTIGMSDQMDQFAVFNAVLEQPRPDWLGNAVNWIDNSNGDLSQTAIEEVQMNPASNKVHIINRGYTVTNQPRGWMKIKVLRSGDGYELQYAPIDSDAYETVQIDKTPNHNFTFFNFEAGVLEVEPPKDDWQIAFSSSITLFRFAGVLVPYAFKDYVFHNRHEVEVAPVLYEEEELENIDILEEFNAFELSMTADLEFNSAINTIGADWRTVSNPQFGGETAVKGDRFYVVLDANGNYYKLLFVGMLSETGERGFPSIQFEQLVP